MPVNMGLHLGITTTFHNFGKPRWMLLANSEHRWRPRLGGQVGALGQEGECGKVLTKEKGIVGRERRVRGEGVAVATGVHWTATVTGFP